MNPSRRTALHGAAALLAASAAGCSQEQLDAPAGSAPNAGTVPPPEAGGVDEQTLEFWTKNVREPATLHAEGLAPKDAPISNPVFV